MIRLVWKDKETGITRYGFWYKDTSNTRSIAKSFIKAENEDFNDQHTWLEER